MTEPPSTEPPSTEPPSTEPPSTEPPSTEPPSTEPPSSASAPEPGRPALRVVRGHPTPAELAALVTVLAARAATVAVSATAAEPPRTLSAWASRRAGLSRGVRPGAGAWRASGLEKGTRTRAAW